MKRTETDAFNMVLDDILDEIPEFEHKEGDREFLILSIEPKLPLVLTRDVLKELVLEFMEDYPENCGRD